MGLLDERLLGNPGQDGDPYDNDPLVQFARALPKDDSSIPGQDTPAPQWHSSLLDPLDQQPNQPIPAGPPGLIDTSLAAGGAALQGLGGSFNTLAKSVNTVAGAVPVMADELASLVSGKLHTGAQDAWFRTFVDPAVANEGAFQLEPGANFGQKAAHAIGGMLGTISQLVLSGGGGAELAPGEIASQVTGDVVRGAVEHGVKSMTVPALSDAVDVGHRVYAQTGDASQAVSAAQVSYLTTAASGVLPLSAPGGLLRRLATGGASGLVTSELGRTAENAVVPEEMQTPFSAEDAAIGGITGAVMGAVAGPRVPDLQRVGEAISRAATDANRAQDAVFNQAMARPAGELEAMPRYQELYASATASTPQEKADYARQTLANELGQAAALHATAAAIQPSLTLPGEQVSARAVPAEAPKVPPEGTAVAPDATPVASLTPPEAQPPSPVGFGALAQRARAAGVDPKTIAGITQSVLRKAVPPQDGARLLQQAIEQVPPKEEGPAQTPAPSGGSAPESANEVPESGLPVEPEAAPAAAPVPVGPAVEPGAAGDAAGHEPPGPSESTAAAPEEVAPPSTQRTDVVSTPTAPESPPPSGRTLRDLSPQSRPAFAAAYQAARDGKPAFDQHLEAIATESGSPHAPKLSPLKSIPRAVEKVLGDYGGDASRLKDVLRGTVVVDSTEQATRALDAARQHFGEPIGLRNGLDPNSPPSSPSGYRDMKFNVRHGDHLAEVQVTVPELLAVKKPAHQLYKQQELIERQARAQGRPLTPAEFGKTEDLLRQQRAIYAAAWDKFLNRSRNAASESTAPLRPKDESGNGRPPDTSQAVQAEPGTYTTGTPSTSANSALEGKESGNIETTSERSITQTPEQAGPGEPGEGGIGSSQSRQQTDLVDEARSPKPGEAQVAQSAPPVAERARTKKPTVPTRGTIHVDGQDVPVKILRYEPGGTSEVIRHEDGFETGVPREVATHRIKLEAEEPTAPPSEAAKPTKAPRRDNRLAKQRAEHLAKLRDAYTPGNIVKGYGGKFDRVIAFHEPKADNEPWSVTVREVVNKDGQWVTDPQHGNERTHSTNPGPHAVVERAAMDKNPAVAPQISGKQVESTAGSQPAAPRSEGVKSKLDDILSSAVQRMAMQEHGQAILDEMEEKGEKPSDVGKKFWSDTYYKLNAVAQRRYQRYAKSLGFEPGDTLSVGRDGARETAQDWQHVGEFLSEDLPEKAEDLEGTQRGFVALMKWANDRAAAADSNVAGDEPKQLLSRGDSAGGSGAAEVRDWLGTATKAVEGVASVHVVENAAELRERAGVEVPEQTRGVYIAGGRDVYLVADQLPDRETAERVFVHEVFGHLAMQHYGEFDKAVAAVIKLRDMGSRSIRDIWFSVYDSHGLMSERQHAGEVIAIMAERGVKNGIMDRMMTAARGLLRKMGVKLEYSEAEVRQLIASAGRALREDALRLSPADDVHAHAADVAYKAGDDQALGEALGKMSIARSQLDVLPNVSEAAHEQQALDDATAEQLVGMKPPAPAGAESGALYSRAAKEDPEIKAIRQRVMANAKNEDLPFKDRLRNALQRWTNLSGLAVRQGFIDGFASIGAYEKLLNGGKLLDASASPYKQTVATQNLPSVMTAIVKAGVPVWRAGAYVAAGDGRHGLLHIFAPLVNHKDGNLLPQWELYAAARRASRLIEEQNPDGSSREKLFTRADIARSMQLAKQYPEFEKAFDQWQGFNKQVLDLAQEAGLINPESRAVWERNDYVPFYRANEDISGTVNPVSMQRSIANQRSKIVTLKGGAQPLEDVFESMLMNTAHLVDASFKNRAAQGMVQMFDGVATSPVNLDAQPVRVDIAQVRRALDAAGITLGSKLTPEQNAQWLTFFQRIKPAGDNIVSVMFEGKPKYYEVHDPLLMQAITQMSPNESLKWLDLLGFTAAKRLLTRTATALPSFIVRNFIRDTQSSWIQNPVGLKPFISAAKGFADYLVDKPVVRDLMLAGAGGDAIYDNQPGNIKKILTREMKAEAADSFLGTIASPRRLWEMYTKLQQASEQANRIAVYRGARAQGMSHAEAAYRAHDVLNFQQRGAWQGVQFLTRVVPFLNARLQGLDRLFRAYKEDRSSFLIKGALMTAFTGLTMALGDQDKRYQELEEWDRDAYWHIFVGDQHWRIPKGFEVGALFGTLPERALRLMRGQDQGKATLGSILNLIGNTFAFNPIPQLARPVLEDLTNYDFFTGRPIINDQQKEQIAPLQSQPYTSPTLQSLAGAEPSWMPDSLRSPLRLEHWIRGYTSAMGMLGLQVADRLTRAGGVYPDAPSKPWYEQYVPATPVTTSPPRNTKYVNQLYDMASQTDAAAKAVQNYASQGAWKQAAQVARENHTELALRPAVDGMVRELGQLNRHAKLIQQSRMDPDRKEAMLDKINTQRADLARQLAPYSGVF